MSYRSILFVSILLLTSPAHAEQSWWDRALDFIGLGSDEAAPEAPAAPPKPAQAAPQPATPQPATPQPAAPQPATPEAPASAGSMMDLASMVTGRLGVTPQQATGGLGTLFSLAKDTLPGSDFATLSGAVPGMDSLLAAAPVLSDSASGLTSLMGNAGKYAEGLQGATTAYARFRSLGLGVDQIPQYIDVTNEFLQSQGSDVASLFQKGVSALLTQ